MPAWGGKLQWKTLFFLAFAGHFTYNKESHDMVGFVWMVWRDSGILLGIKKSKSKITTVVDWKTQTEEETSAKAVTLRWVWAQLLQQIILPKSGTSTATLLEMTGRERRKHIFHPIVITQWKYCDFAIESSWHVKNLKWESFCCGTFPAATPPAGFATVRSRPDSEPWISPYWPGQSGMRPPQKVGHE